MENHSLVRILANEFGEDVSSIENVLGLSLRHQLERATTIAEFHGLWQKLSRRDKSLAARALKKGEELLLERVKLCPDLNSLVPLLEFRFRRNSKATKALEEKIFGLYEQQAAVLTTIEDCQTFWNESPEGGGFRSILARRARVLFKEALDRLSTVEECCDLERQADAWPQVLASSSIRSKKLVMLRERLAASTTVDQCVKLQRLNGCGEGARDFRDETIRKAAEILKVQQPE